MVCLGNQIAIMKSYYKKMLQDVCYAMRVSCLMALATFMPLGKYFFLYLMMLKLFNEIAIFIWCNLDNAIWWCYSPLMKMQSSDGLAVFDVVACIHLMMLHAFIWCCCTHSFDDVVVKFQAFADMMTCFNFGFPRWFAGEKFRAFQGFLYIFVHIHLCLTRFPMLIYHITSGHNVIVKNGDSESV
jgi:hypothetical protein